MSEIENGKTRLIDDHSFPNEGKVFVINEEPIMECALDILYHLGGSGLVTLKAKGNAIPTAVAVANVLTENMMKGNSKIVDIIVDSESGTGKYGMTLISTIKIIITKTN